MNEPVVVVSVFDGASCGRIALDVAEIPVKEYYASEIDKYAQIVSAKNYPDIIRLGNVLGVSEIVLPEKVDLLIGGSPCQGFSFAGKQLNFDDPRSVLFFEFVRLLEVLRESNPDIEFLLENVKMKKEYQDVISNILGVEPIEINSALVSAQNRKRLYWTNIKGITQPEDKGILLKDIVHEYSLVDRDKSIALTASYQQTSPRDFFEKSRGQMVYQTSVIKSHGEYKDKGLEKSMCLDANYYKGEGNHGQRTQILELEKYIIPFEKAVLLFEKEVEKGKIKKINFKGYEVHGYLVTAKEGRFIFGETDNLIEQCSPLKQSNVKHGEFTQPFQQNNVYNINGKTTAITASSARVNVAIDHPVFGVITPDRVEKRQNGQRFSNGMKFYTLTAQDKHGVLVEGYIRKLTPIECERLQTLPDNYTEGVSNSQRYKMLGNGWTVDVIAHILSFSKHAPIL